MTEKLNRNKASFGLSELLKYVKILSIKDLELSDEMTMKDTKKLIENKILNEVHPYAIFEVKGVPGQYMTQVADSTKKSGRRFIRKMGYERLVEALIEHYMKDLNLDMTMDALFDRWAIFRRDETAVKDGTIRRDSSLYRTHCKDVQIDGLPLGSWKVAELGTKKLYSFFRKLTKDRTYSRKMVSNIRGVLSGMFSYAVEQDIIPTNPAREVDLKRLTYKPEQDRRDNVFSKEDAKALLEHLAPLDEPYALAIRLDFNLFARIGEIAALKWENVDFEKRTIYICSQITYEPVLNDDMTFSEKRMVTETYLKGCTSQGYRREYITDEALEVLKKAREINPDGEYVFMPNGRPIITLTFNKRLRSYCEEAGIKYHSSHKIRFYAASAAYDGKNLSAISRMMGHSQISTTLQYLRDVEQKDDYSDVFMNLGLQAGN